MLMISELQGWSNKSTTAAAATTTHIAILP